MSVILALETTSAVCSVALAAGENVVIETTQAPRRHNRLVLPMVDSVCESLGIARRTIDCVAFSAGPGSFTGVRLGAAIAQGIAAGTGARIYRAPTSLCMAERVFRSERKPGEIIVQRVSRRDLVYEARIYIDASGGSVLADDILKSTSGAANQEVPVYTEKDVSLCASAVLALAKRDRQNWLEPSQALPLYVEGDSPWQPAKQP